MGLFVLIKKAVMSSSRIPESSRRIDVTASRLQVKCLNSFLFFPTPPRYLTKAFWFICQSVGEDPEI